MQRESSITPVKKVTHTHNQSTYSNYSHNSSRKTLGEINNVSIKNKAQEAAQDPYTKTNTRSENRYAAQRDVSPENFLLLIFACCDYCSLLPIR